MWRQCNVNATYCNVNAYVLHAACMLHACSMHAPCMQCAYGMPSTHHTSNTQHVTRDTQGRQATSSMSSPAEKIPGTALARTTARHSGSLSASFRSLARLSSISSESEFTGRLHIRSTRTAGATCTSNQVISNIVPGSSRRANWLTSDAIAYDSMGPPDDKRHWARMNGHSRLRLLRQSTIGAPCQSAPAVTVWNLTEIENYGP